MCWRGRKKSLSSVSYFAQLKKNEKKNPRPYSLRHAHCALLVRRAAAAEENSSDRLCGCRIACHNRASRSGLHAAVERAWVCGRPEYRNRLPMGRGKVRTPARCCPRVKLCRG